MIRRHQEQFALPELQNGEQIQLTLRALSFGEITVSEGGVPTMPGEASENKNSISDPGALVERWRKLASFGVVAPEMTFGERRDGVPDWDDLLFANQGAVVNKLYEMSGRGGWTKEQKEGAGAAERLAKFPEDSGRSKDSREDHAPGRPGSAAAVSVARA